MLCLLLRGHFPSHSTPLGYVVASHPKIHCIPMAHRPFLISRLFYTFLPPMPSFAQYFILFSFTFGPFSGRSSWEVLASTRRKLIPLVSSPIIFQPFGSSLIYPFRCIFNFRYLRIGVRFPLMPLLRPLGAFLESRLSEPCKNTLWINTSLGPFGGYNFLCVTQFPSGSQSRPRPRFLQIAPSFPTQIILPHFFYFLAT